MGTSAPVIKILTVPERRDNPFRERVPERVPVHEPERVPSAPVREPERVPAHASA